MKCLKKFSHTLSTGKGLRLHKNKGEKQASRKRGICGQVAKNIITEKIKNMGIKCTTSFFLKYAYWFGYKELLKNRQDRKAKCWIWNQGVQKEGGKNPTQTNSSENKSKSLLIAHSAHSESTNGTKSLIHLYLCKMPQIQSNMNLSAFSLQQSKHNLMWIVLRKMLNFISNIKTLLTQNHKETRCDRTSLFFFFF